VGPFRTYATIHLAPQARNPRLSTRPKRRQFPAVRQIVVHHNKRISFSWRRFFGLGLHADSSIRENARREHGLCLAGFQKRIWLSEKQLLNLRCHRITMVQATESRKKLNLAFARRANFCRPTCGRALRESEMRPVLVIIEQVGRHQPFEMPLIQDDFVVQQVASATSHPAFRNTVLPRTAKGCSSWLASHVPHSRKHLGCKLASRSNSKNLCGCW
jgi:hypothetical protein